MDKSLPQLSFDSLGSTARQAASSAFTSAFNTVVTQPVNTIKNNITNNSSNISSSYNSNSIDIASNENTSTESDSSSAKSTKFFQVINLTKAVNIISTLPSTTNSKKSSQTNLINLNQSTTTNSFTNDTNSTSSSPRSLTQTASSVLNRINPFEQSFDSSNLVTPKSANLKKFLFSAAASFSIDLTNSDSNTNKIRLNNSLDDSIYNDDSILNIEEENLDEIEQDCFNQEMLESNENENGNLNRIRTSMKQRKSKPAGSIEYQVADNDTIEKIALKWNTIPSEILHLNRLVTRTIFPGQIIYVPDPNYVPPPPTPPQNKSPPLLTKQLSLNDIEKTPNQKIQNQTNTSTSGGFSFLRWKNNSKPGHAEQQKSVDLKDERRGSKSRHMLSEEEAKKLDEECMQRFLKINCKIVTRSKGCYDGVLIITPSALMFDPFDVSITATNNSNTNNAQSNDDTSSSELSASQQKARTASTSSGSNSIYDEASAIIPIEVISNIIMYEDLALKDVQEYFDYQETKEFIMNTNQTNQSKSKQETIDIINEVDMQQTKSRRISSSSSSSHRVTFDLTQTNDDTIELVKQNDTQPSDETSNKKETEAKKQDSPNINKDEPECELKPNSDLISCYLCIKVNNNKDFLYCPIDRKMKNKLRSEFWFQIYDNSTDKIFAFFLEWRGDSQYNSLNNHDDENQSQQQQLKTNVRRFQVVKPHENLTDLIDQSLKADLHKNYSSTNRLLNKYDTFTKDWEMVNLQELELKLKTEKEIEKEYKTLPTLMNESLILKEEHLRKLNVNLIARAIGYNWVLSFSTEEHGFSLNTIYRKLAEVEGPCLVVVKDTNNNVFGAMSSTKLYQSEHFYGTGESFLFTFTPTFRVFKWTGENNFFTRGQNDSISFGCSDGHHGLWFDGDLLNGHTQKCTTYDNDLLTIQENFTIASLEVWSFSD